MILYQQIECSKGLPQDEEFYDTNAGKARYDRNKLLWYFENGMSTHTMVEYWFMPAPTQQPCIYWPDNTTAANCKNCGKPQWHHDKNQSVSYSDISLPKGKELVIFLLQNVLINLSTDLQIFFAKDLQERFLTPKTIELDFYAILEKHWKKVTNQPFDETTKRHLKYCVDAMQEAVEQKKIIVALPEVRKDDMNADAWDGYFIAIAKIKKINPGLEWEQPENIPHK